MDVRANLDDGKVVVQLDVVEASYLISFLMGSKFPDGAKPEFFMHPMLNALLAGLMANGRELGGDFNWFAGDKSDFELSFSGGLRPSESMRQIKAYVEKTFARDDQAARLEDAFYPFKLGAWPQDGG
jgi:hypothetical protein